MSKPLSEVVNESLTFAEKQSLLMAQSLEDQPTRLPKTIDQQGELETCGSEWWVSGFFPGVLWYLYENSEEEQVKEWATNYTLRVEDQQYTTDNHDVGFMIFCSFGNAYRLTNNEAYKKVIETASESLITRFNPTVGCIRSWDEASWSKQWEFPVIIDNMMNLEMLLWAGKTFDNPEFTKVAETHANTTMKHHFRDDFSSYHVVSCDTLTGEPEAKHTTQGYSHESAWARGQAWGLYGYVMMYREWGNQAYLKQAVIDPSTTSPPSGGLVCFRAAHTAERINAQSNPINQKQVRVAIDPTRVVLGQLKTLLGLVKSLLAQSQL